MLCVGAQAIDFTLPGVLGSRVQDYALQAFHGCVMATGKLADRRVAIERKGRVRELVFGVQDGLISTVGLITAIQSATANSTSVILTGLAAMFTGALSMATGSYLSTRAEKEIFEGELAEQADFVDATPYLVQEGLMDALKAEGLSRSAAYRIVKIVSDQRGVFLRTFQEKVLGLGSTELNKPLQAALVMYLSFVVGAFVPLFPYFLLPVGVAMLVSVGLTALSLFLVGFFKGYLARRSVWTSGLEFLLVALGSAALGWGVGALFEWGLR